MKKLISLFLVCLLMLSCVTLAHAASEPEEKFPNASYDAVKTASAPKIDGVMDDAYKAAPVVKIDKKIMVDLLYDESEIATGEMRILWDANNLYVFATIHDATWAAPYKDTGWFNNCDSLWFATGANADLTRVNCYAVARAGKAYKNFYEEAGAPAIEFASKNLYKGKEVAMTTYGNAEGSYPANCPKPTGAVDSYVLEIKIPYAGNTAGRKVYFGAFLCDDTDFNEKILTQNIADSFNLVDGRSRTSEAVSTVKDNGIGIPKEAQTSVFERFYRVDKSRSKATGGTGLGLAIVKHIARIHNARIKLESQVDVGTTITITFPTAS